MILLPVTGPGSQTPTIKCGYYRIAKTQPHHEDKGLVARNIQSVGRLQSPPRHGAQLAPPVERQVLPERRHRPVVCGASGSLSRRAVVGTPGRVATGSRHSARQNSHKPRICCSRARILVRCCLSGGGLSQSKLSLPPRSHHRARSKGIRRSRAPIPLWNVVALW